MRIAQALLTAALLLAACAAPQAPPGAAGGAAGSDAGSDAGPDAGPDAEIADPGELVVLVAAREPTLSRAIALGYAAEAVHPLGALEDVLIALRIPPGRTIAEAIDEIEAAAPGATAGAHHLYRLQAASHAAGDRAYANALIGWPAEGCPARRPVGMIDAGLPPGDPRLADGRVVERRFFDGDGPPATDHGAVMADLLIGPGRLTGARLHSANVVDPARHGGDAAGVVAILRAMDWLRSEGVEIVNVSLAGPPNKLLDRALGRAAEAGAVIVAAAGNDGPDAPPRYPAAFPFVLAVTAVDRALDVYPQAVRGAQIDLAAPGVDILLARAGGVRLVSGTSAAAPFVTAAVAADPALAGEGVAEVRRHLADGARDIGPAGPDPVFGAGLVATPEACRNTG